MASVAPGSVVGNASVPEGVLVKYVVVSDYSLQYLGGAQVAMLRQAEALASMGHEVHLIAPGGSDETMPFGVTYIAPPAARVIPVVGLPVFTNTNTLRQWFDEHFTSLTPDAVLTHSEFGLAVAAVQVAHIRKAVTLHTVHTFFWRSNYASDVFAGVARSFYQRRTGLVLGNEKLTKHRLANTLRLMTLAMCRQVDVVISPSAHQGARLAECGLARVEVISNVTASVVSPEHGEAPTDRTVLLWAARFAPEKRLAVAVSAMGEVKRRLREQGRDANLVELQVAGGAAQSDPNVTWLGQLTPDQVRARISNSNAIVITSVGFDNQPMVALEAFAAGRPVIVSDPVLATEFSDSSIKANSTDAHGLAETILQLADDSTIIARASEAATVRARLSSPQGHVAALDAVVASIRK